LPVPICPAARETVPAITAAQTNVIKANEGLTFRKFFILLLLQKPTSYSEQSLGSPSAHNRKGPDYESSQGLQQFKVHRMVALLQHPTPRLVGTNRQPAILNGDAKH